MAPCVPGGTPARRSSPASLQTHRSTPGAASSSSRGPTGSATAATRRDRSPTPRSPRSPSATPATGCSDGRRGTCRPGENHLTVGVTLHPQPGWSGRSPSPPGMPWGPMACQSPPAWSTSPTPLRPFGRLAPTCAPSRCPSRKVGRSRLRSTSRSTIGCCRPDSNSSTARPMTSARPAGRQERASRHGIPGIARGRRRKWRARRPAQRDAPRYGRGRGLPGMQVFTGRRGAARTPARRRGRADDVPTRCIQLRGSR